MGLKCIIAGHSFVSGLAEHLANSAPRARTPSEVAIALRVSQLVTEVTLLGQRGAKVNNLAVSLKHERADILVLDIGTNDLVIDPSPNNRLKVAALIMSLAKSLLDDGNVRHIICSVIPREEGLRGAHVGDFFQAIFHFNGILKEVEEIRSY